MQQATAVAAFTVVPSHVLGGRAQAAPSERLNIAGIGIGGVGKAFLQGCASDPTARIAFLCDVDHDYARPVFEQYPQAKRYRDYRELFDKENDSIDAVLVATPDHTHAVISMEAVRRHKHILCVKPLCHDIGECRELMRLAKEKNVVTQMGIQGHASPFLQEVQGF